MNEDKTPDAAVQAEGGRATWRTALLSSALVLVALMVAAFQTQSISFDRFPNFALAMYFAIKQDIPVAALGLAVLAVLWLRSDDGRAAPGGATLRLRGLAAFAVLVLPAVIAWFLRAHVLPDYDLSRDEQMVTFDAAIFAGGRLFAPIPEFWREYYTALNVTYVLPIGDREAWVSGYLPGNVAIRAALGTVFPAAMHSPLLLLVAALALWRIAARLWTDSASTRAVVVLLFASSTQAIVTATATYAMTAHLALNLVWLLLFLRRTPRGHAGAILIGFVATGLHQPVFHPMFVAPFMLLLLRERAWKELSAYVACYAAIGLFWLGWQPWVASHGLHPVPAAHSNDGVDYIERFRRTLTPLTAASFWVMAANLLRFFAWNNILLLPLAAVTLLVAPLRRDPLIQSLWLGMAAVVVFMTVVLPAQVNGWGYRYLHGFIGCAVLLAGYGWRWLEDRGTAPLRAIVAMTGIAVLAVLPVQAWMAGGQLAGYAAGAAKLRAADADMVIVDLDVPFAEDLVLNRADLSNRPILLSSIRLTAPDLPGLCRHGTIAFADAPQFGEVSAYFGIRPPQRATPTQRKLRAAASSAGCRIVPFALTPSQPR